MARVTTTVELNSNIETVWNVVTSLDDYAWRKDIQKIEIIEPGKFAEHTKDGYTTTFTITVFEPLERYEFDIENENMHGHWVGIFKRTNTGTTITFTEDVTAKKVMMKPMVGMYLKSQQKNYIKYLKEKLNV